MYYENKRSFYIKQYGPVAIVVVIALALIVTGVVIGLKTMNKSNVVAKEPTVENKEEVIVDTDAYKFSAQAIKGTVTAVNGTIVTVKADNITYDVNLIGITPNDKYADLSKTMSTDLNGKAVTVDFDSVKTEDGQVYGYIFLDNKLYNETLLSKGYAELRTERSNINKLDVLVAAQIKARHDGLGIWKY